MVHLGSNQLHRGLVSPGVVRFYFSCDRIGTDMATALWRGGTAEILQCGMLAQFVIIDEPPGDSEKRKAPTAVTVLLSVHISLMGRSGGKCRASSSDSRVGTRGTCSRGSFRLLKDACSACRAKKAYFSL